MKILVCSPFSPTSIYLMLSTLDISIMVDKSLAFECELSLSMHREEFREFLRAPVEPLLMPTELPSMRLLSSASKIAYDIFLTWDNSYIVLEVGCPVEVRQSGCLSTLTSLLPSLVLLIVVISYSLVLFPVWVVFSMLWFLPLPLTSKLSNRVDLFLTIFLVKDFFLIRFWGITCAF